MTVVARLALFSDEEWAVIKEDLGLSPRQADITERICRGMSDKRIACELGIALPTVRTHTSRLYEKLDTADRLELVLSVFMAWRARSGGCVHSSGQDEGVARAGM
jgi:DNA-binding NarL/FixJ family response regulator